MINTESELSKTIEDWIKNTDLSKIKTEKLRRNELLQQINKEIRNSPVIGIQL